MPYIKVCIIIKQGYCYMKSQILLDVQKKDAILMQY